MYRRIWWFKSITLFLRTEYYERIVSVYLLNKKKCAYLLDITLFVCLCVFVWVLSSTSRIFHSFAVTYGSLQIFTWYVHVLPLSCEGSLACHTYCDTGHLFIMVISKDPWDSHLLPSVWQWSCYYLFLQLRSLATGIRTPNLPLARRTL